MTSADTSTERARPVSGAVNMVDPHRVPELTGDITCASMEAHLAALAALSARTARVVPDPFEVATALAHAYGQAVGLLVASGATEEQTFNIGRISLAARDAEISKAR